MSKRDAVRRVIGIGLGSFVLKVQGLGKKVKQNPAIAVIVTIILSAVGSVGLIVVATIGPFVTRPGALVIDLVVLWFLLRALVRSLVFPGSVMCWKRSTEQSFKVEIAKQFCHHLTFLYSVMQQVAGVPPDKEWTFAKAGMGVSVLDTLVRNFEMQQQDKVDLSEQQHVMSHLASKISAALKAAKVQFSIEPNIHVSMHSYLLGKIDGGSPADILGLSAHDGSRSFVRLKDHIVIDRSKELMYELEQLIALLKELHSRSKENCFKRARNFMAVPTVGSLHAIRAELSFRYKGQQMWIRGKNAMLDAMFIPTRPDATIDSVPIVVCCNPNAGYYETMVYQSDWLEFYLSRGVSVMVFNYRGYGRSRGRPSPNAVREDGNLVVSHLFSLGCTQVGIHGRSIGGVAACYAATKHSLAFCVADRTFSSLGLTAKYTYGNWAEQGLRVCGTSCDNTDYYYSIPPECMKVLMVDPNDAIIPDFASLRTAVALKQVENMAPGEKLHFHDVNLERLVNAFTYLQRIFEICDSTDREMRAPTFTRYNSLEERRPSWHYVSSDGPKSWTDLQWLEANADLVRTQFPGDFLASLRQAADSFLCGINAVGTSLDDALSQDHNAGNPIRAIKCLMANLQVWGSLPTEDFPTTCNWKSANGVTHTELLRYLSGADSETRLRETEKRLTASDIADFYRYTAKVQVAAQKKEFRQKTASITREAEELGQRLPNLVHLAKDAIVEFDSFIAHVARYFKRSDIEAGEGASQVSTSDSSDDGDRLFCAEVGDALHLCQCREKLGYQVLLECGHNGQPEAHEVQQLGLYLYPVIARMLENIECSPKDGTIDL
eukprot:GEMP01013906.1.p1 GENE.GEMP01013906.1~~GEMP01013906.1.p1  ORF type:complete len:832 (+),score=114.40 GEMP01013906.1:284-2779(+)